MIRSWLYWCVMSLLICGVLTLLAPCAQAGPSLLCWPYDIGGARSLPFVGDNWRSADPNYNLQHLADDTLALLQPGTPVLVRMETLRRATIYAMKDRDIAADLLRKLEARVAAAQAQSKADALALFDLGYLLEAYKQADVTGTRQNLATGRDGVVLIEQAIGLRGNEPEMEFAAALALAHSRIPPQRKQQHLERALAGAAEGSLLTKNLVSHAHIFDLHGTSLAELRTQLVAKNR
jgi:hypothetical protein